MAQPIHVLLIDDEKDYCDTLKTNARHSGILIADFQNLEDGFKELEKELKYKAIIFDAKCLIDEKEEVDNFGFLPIALDRLKEFEQKHDVHLPFVVNTGYAGEKEISMITRQVETKKGKVFDKGEPKDILFQYLLNEINKAGITKLEKEYQDVFQVFEKGYLPNNMRDDLINILQNCKNSTPAKIKDNLATIRRILDEILTKINSLKPSVLPNSKRNFMDKIKWLSGQKRVGSSTPANYVGGETKYQTSSNEYLATAIWKISSDFGSHSLPTNAALYKAFPSSYAVQALTYSILEIIIWYIELMDND